MRKPIAILIVILLAISGAYSQVALSDFQSAFEGFADDLAGTLALNSTIGSNWSDAYIGGFPHFGAGATVGASFVNVDSAKSLFESMGGSLPSAFDTLGLPIPAAVLTAKIGIPFLPIDVGLKGGYIPPSVGEAINKSSGMSVDYANVGIQVRYAIIKQNVVLPNISIGASYNYQKGSLRKTIGSGATYDVPIGASTYHVYSSDPEASVEWSANVFDFTVQASKKLLVFIPYVGAGLSVGKSTVKGGVEATVSTDYNSNDLDGLEALIESNGGTAPDLSSTGIIYTTDSTAPVFRLYGGFSFRLVVDLDIQAMYVPAAKSLGGSATLRFQL